MSDEILNFEDFVQKVISALEAGGVDYLVGGAVAAGAWGEPRATLDLDLVVNISMENARQLSKELEKRDMLVPEEIILEKLLEDRADLPIQAVHIYSGFKAALYPLRTGDELRASAFARRQRIDLGEPLGEVYLHSPEDLVIYKLWFYCLGRQTKHLRDITAIVMTLGDKLDLEYIESWAAKKGLTVLWDELLGRIRDQL